MLRFICLLMLAAAGCSDAVPERLSTNPFPEPIEAARDVISVSYVEFATIPATADGEAPRMMHMLDEPQTQRLFVSTMRGMLYSLSYDGRSVTPYLDIGSSHWNIGVQFSSRERGLQSFAFHPQFGSKGMPGYGKFYTYLDTTNTRPKADFTTPGRDRPHDTVLLEWSAKDPAAPVYDGEAPREIFRAAQPYPNHNGGQIAFNPAAQSGASDYGLLYVGLADGGSGGDPHGVAQNLRSPFGKILRIDPLAPTPPKGKYGIPESNPFVGRSGARGEIYAYGLRNPQRFTWDSKDGRMYVADIGQKQIEEISEVTAGANLGWSLWEGSFRYVNRKVDLDTPRSAPGMIWPIVEYDHQDPLLQGVVAITGIVIYRGDEIATLRNRMIFGDNPSGEIFHVDADRLPAGGDDAIRRILLKDGGADRTLLQLIRAKNAAQGKEPAPRADLRFGTDRDGRIYLLNKYDGIVRLLVPDGNTAN